jgi:hypothetical protein
MQLKINRIAVYFRYGAYLGLLGCVGIFVYTVVKQPISLTTDSNSFFETARVFIEQGAFFWEPSRTPGYPFLILLFAVLSGAETIKELWPLVVFTQKGIYIFLCGSSIYFFWRLAGVFGGITVAALFAADHFNINWIATISSLAPSRILLIAAINFLALGIYQRSYLSLLAAMALVSLAPLFRPSDIVFPLAALIGVIVYLLLERPKIWRTIVAIPLLLGPTALLICYNGAINGIFSPDTRSAPLFAARALALADPERLVKAGVPLQIIKQVARPMHERFTSSGPVSIPYVNDLGKEDGTSIVLCPFDRKAIVSRLSNADPERFQTSSPYRQAAELQSIGRKAFLADIPGYWGCIKYNFWDFVRLPVLRPLRDISLKNKSLLLPVIAPFLFAGLIFIFRRRSNTSISIVIACLSGAVGYWLLCSILLNYVVRIAMHPWLPIALTALLAWCVTETAAGLRSKSNEK